MLKNPSFRQITPAKQICGLKMPPNERRRIKTIFNHFRNKHARYEIAIGDAIGSSIIDAGFSIGFGTLFFPGNVTASLAERTGL